MNDKEAQVLLEKYNSGKASNAEVALLQYWFIRQASRSGDSMNAHAYSKLNGEIWTLIKHQTRPVKMKMWQQIAAVASIAIIIGIGFYLYRSPQENSVKNNFTADIAPGGNSATLILANGKRIVLTSAKAGKLAEQDGVEITKTSDGQLTYAVSDFASAKYSEKIDYNSVETPNGGKYQIILPDGSKVWLNAASAIRYPSTFAGAINRAVELLRGEAYFEVAKDKKHRFIVKADQQEVEVLGTHFNINTYKDDNTVKTTLLEGSIRLNKNTLLKPGQQATLTNNSVQVQEIDAESAIAWQRGKFLFINEELGTIMKKIARWYNVEVHYQDAAAAKETFWGTISCFNNVSEVLKMLELTKRVHFKIEGRRIIVSK